MADRDSELPAWQDDMRSLGLVAGSPVKATRRVERPASEVWRAIATPGYLANCHPFCRSTEVERWPGEGSRDSITYLSGIRYQRHFVSWCEGVGYDIELGEHPHLTARVLWRTLPHGGAESEFSIEVFPLLRRTLSNERRAAYQQRLFGNVLEHYLGCVVRGVAWFATTGKAVEPNQFGRSEMYSEPA